MKTQTSRTNTLFAAGAKRIAIALLTAAALFAGCKEKEYDPEAEPTLSISPMPETIAFSADGSESYTFRVNTNQPVWLPYPDKPWCRITLDAGAGTFTVTALPNHAETPPEPATITVTAGKAAPLTFTATQAAAEYDLYVSGHYADEIEGGIVCYWKNGVKTDLPTPAGMYQAESAAMAVGNGSVYIAGAVDSRACYWKDGEYVGLTDPDPAGGSAPFYPSIDIAVDNGTVHLISSEYYWKGSEQPVKIATQGFKGHGIDASDGIYCISGAMYISIGNYGDKAVFKTNGPRDALDIDADARDSKATCVSLTDGTAYFGGQYRIGDRVQACYWKNGACTPVDMPQGTTEVSVRSICVENGKVYIAGYCSDGTHSAPCYWVDGTHVELELPYPTSRASAEDITVVNGKVYVAGYYKDAEEWPDLACYWVNGKRFDLEKEAGMIDFAATGIALVKKTSKP